MKVEFHSWDGLIGTATLLPDGRIHIDSPRVKRLIASAQIVEPGTFELLTEDQGERYLRALPAVFRGMYLQASLIEE